MSDKKSKRFYKAIPQQLLDEYLDLPPAKIYGPWLFELDAVAKERPRARRQGNFTRIYTPNKTAQFEETLCNMFIAQNKGFTPIDAPLRVTILIGKKIPKYKARKDVIYNSVKPDVDNYAKSILDALEGRLFVNDSRIFDLRVIKTYQETPIIILKVEEF